MSKVNKIADDLKCRSYGMGSCNDNEYCVRALQDVENLNLIDESHSIQSVYTCAKKSYYDLLFETNKKSETTSQKG